jgi:23S rRNA (adenine2030-N6)-methyltransferase
MNYRHAYHAGNFADCVKHALFILLLQAMQRKPTPLLLLDTHAGRGRYNLSESEALKTGEWKDGIAQVQAARPAALVDYITLIETLGLYPGSPVIAASMLRPADRLVCCELHQEDAQILRATLARQKKICAVHQRDGYTALKTFLPPPEKRALVLIDPPYERDDEFSKVTESLAAAYQKFKSGVYVVWYPVKHLAPLRNFYETIKLTKLRDVITLAFLRRPPLDPTRLNGCGLLVVNPPYGFIEAAEPILQAFKTVLGEAGASVSVERLIDE